VKGQKPQPSEEAVLNVVGERVALEPLREDLLLYGRWINDFLTTRVLGLPPAPVTAGKERDWYEKRSKAQNDAMFTIYGRETLRPIGNTALHHRNKSASFQRAGPLGPPRANRRPALAGGRCSASSPASAIARRN
jgi:hypothetical protein